MCNIGVARCLIFCFIIAVEILSQPDENVFLSVFTMEINSVSFIVKRTNELREPIVSFVCIGWVKALRETMFCASFRPTLVK